MVIKMEWNMLRKHVKYWKNGKVLNSSMPLQRKSYQPQHKSPVYAVINYQARLEEWGLAEDLLSGKINRLSVMG